MTGSCRSSPDIRPPAIAVAPVPETTPVDPAVEESQSLQSTPSSPPMTLLAPAVTAPLAPKPLSVPLPPMPPARPPAMLPDPAVTVPEAKALLMAPAQPRQSLPLAPTRPPT